MKSGLLQFLVLRRSLSITALVLATALGVAPAMSGTPVKKITTGGGEKAVEVTITAIAKGPIEADKSISRGEVYNGHLKPALHECKKAYASTNYVRLDSFKTISRDTRGNYMVESNWGCLENS